jgi:TolB-like protein
MIWKLLIIISLASCTQLRALKYKTLPPNPRSDIKRIAIAPFVNQTKQPIEGERFGNIFATELLRFRGFEVIRPHAVAKVARGAGIRLESIKDAIDLAGVLKADAILTGSITDYDPYFPPKIAISIQIFRLKQRALSSEDINRLIQSASWKPLPFSREGAKNLLLGIERVIDTSSAKIRDEIEAYARVYGSEETAFDRGEEFLRIGEKFWQFSSCFMILEMIKNLR